MIFELLLFFFSCRKGELLPKIIIFMCCSKSLDFSLLVENISSCSRTGPINAAASNFDHFSQLANLERSVVNLRLADCLLEDIAKIKISCLL